MKSSRILLLFASSVLVIGLIGGGLMVKVGATENDFQSPVVFAEVLDRVLRNYVDPVEAMGLYEGAFEGMLSALDANGAYLTPEELADWRAEAGEDQVDPGLSILKSGRTLLIVAIDPGSSADEAGISIGDHIRNLDGQPVNNLSLEQSRRLLRGKTGSSIAVGLMHPRDGFSREEVELIRAPRKGAAYELTIDRGIGVLSIKDVNRLSKKDLAEELDDVRTRGIKTLLIDIRNVANADPREITALTSLFAKTSVLLLSDRAGKEIERVEIAAQGASWPGEIALLVNGATAAGAEALTAILKETRDAEVYGTTTFGLGAEPELIEFPNGGALLVSTAEWATSVGDSWHGDGIEPDHEVDGDGETFEEVAADQLEEVLTSLVKENPETVSEDQPDPA
jgi:carboxyl-terminal processing protease